MQQDVDATIALPPVLVGSCGVEFSARAHGEAVAIHAEPRQVVANALRATVPERHVVLLFASRIRTAHKAKRTTGQRPSGYALGDLREHVVVRRTKKALVEIKFRRASGIVKPELAGGRKLVRNVDIGGDRDDDRRRWRSRGGRHFD